MNNDIHPAVRRVATILVLVGLSFVVYWKFETGWMDFLSEVDWRFEFQKSRGLLGFAAVVGAVLAVGLRRWNRRRRTRPSALAWTLIIMLFFTPAIVFVPGVGSVQAGVAIAPGFLAVIAAILVPFQISFLTPNVILAIVVYKTCAWALRNVSSRFDHRGDERLVGGQ